MAKETYRGEFVSWRGEQKKGRPGFASVRYESSGHLIDAVASGPFSPLMQSGEWFLAEGKVVQSEFRGQPQLKLFLTSVLPDLPLTEVGAIQIFRTTFNFDRHAISIDAIKEFVAKHGSKAALKVEKNPQLLFEMSKNPTECGPEILKAWNLRVSAREPFRVLEAAGVSEVALKSIIQFHRDNTMNIINSNPYELAELHKVGFLEADKIGKYKKIPKSDLRRVRSAVREAISGNRIGNGSTYSPVNELLDQLPVKDIEDKVALGVLFSDSSLDVTQTSEGFIAQDVVMRNNEMFIATKVSEMVEAGLKASSDHIDDVSEKVLSQQKYAVFDEIQRSAVMTSARERIAILTGGPGTGKSTVTEAIAEIASLTSSGPVILGAPTGKAAVRLMETTKKNASTVHRVLGAQGGASVSFNYNRNNQLPAGCTVIIDEASMLDVELTAALLEAIPSDGKLLLVGDKHQLPSVGAGYVLGDLIGAEGVNGIKVPVSELSKVYRSDSVIATSAAKMRDGTFSAGFLSNVMRDGIVMYDLDGQAMADKVVSMFNDDQLDRFQVNHLSEIAILCPQRTGICGTNQLNEMLSKKLNPRGAAIFNDATKNGPNGPLPRVGDRVMVTKNDYEHDIMNGDIGTIKSASNAKSADGRQTKVVKIEFDSGKTVEIPESRARELILAYAITGHKSQGSQYKVVIMPISPDHERMLDRTLVYTEWTRTKEKLVLVGNRDLLDASVKKVTAGERKTRLKTFLSEKLSYINGVEAKKSAASIAVSGSAMSRPAGVSRPAPLTRPAPLVRPPALGRPAALGRPTPSPTSPSPGLSRPTGMNGPSKPIGMSKPAGMGRPAPAASPTSSVAQGGMGRPAFQGMGRPPVPAKSAEPEEEPLHPKF